MTMFEKFNSLTYFSECISKYCEANNINPDDWKICSIGTGSAYDSWHLAITLMNESEDEITIRVPMYSEANKNFEKFLQST